MGWGHYKQTDHPPPPPPPPSSLPALESKIAGGLPTDKDKISQAGVKTNWTTTLTDEVRERVCVCVSKKREALVSATQQVQRSLFRCD